MDKQILKVKWNSFEKDIEFSCNAVTSFYGKINSMDNDELELFRKKLKYPENVDVQKLLREDGKSTFILKTPRCNLGKVTE